MKLTLQLVDLVIGGELKDQDAPPNSQEAMRFNPIYVVHQNFKFQFFIFLN
jgi:hypothetical protein